MSITTYPNEAAFGFDSYRTGLTKREYLAAMAMQGILAAGCLPTEEEFEAFSRLVSSESVRYADALIDALNASPNRAGLTG